MAQPSQSVEPPQNPRRFGLGGTDCFDAGFVLADALSSRPLIVITSDGPRGIFRLSDKTTQSRRVNETAGSSPLFRRIYMRPLN